jgi:hypothetical protein
VATDPTSNQRVRDALLVHCVALAFFAFACALEAASTRWLLPADVADAAPELVFTSSLAGLVFWIWALVMARQVIAEPTGNSLAEGIILAAFVEVFLGLPALL